MNIFDLLMYAGGSQLFTSFSGDSIDFWGDSNTEGYGLSNPTAERWPKLLSDELGVTENNYGISGTTLQYQEELGSGAEPSLYTRHTSVINPYTTQKLIFIGYGINDAKNTFSTYTPEELGVQFLEILNYLHTTLNYPKEKIKVVNDFYTEMDDSVWDTEYQENVNIITLKSAEFGCQCINIKNKFISYGGTLNDIVHPTAYGHSVIKNIILEELW